MDPKTGNWFRRCFYLWQHASRFSELGKTTRDFRKETTDLFQLVQTVFESWLAGTVLCVLKESKSPEPPARALPAAGGSLVGELRALRPGLYTSLG